MGEGWRKFSKIASHLIQDPLNHGSQTVEGHNPEKIVCGPKFNKEKAYVGHKLLEKL
jgi:hypothetical protein